MSFLEAAIGVPKDDVVSFRCDDNRIDPPEQEREIMHKDRRDLPLHGQILTRPRVVSVRDAVRLCGVGKTSIYKCLANGALKRAEGTPLKRCLITMDSIETFLRA